MAEYIGGLLPQYAGRGLGSVPTYPLPVPRSSPPSLLRKSADPTFDTPYVNGSTPTPPTESASASRTQTTTATSNPPHYGTTNFVNYMPAAAAAGSKPEWKRYKQYSKEDLLQAIEDVKKGMTALQVNNLNLLLYLTQAVYSTSVHYASVTEYIYLSHTNLVELR